VKIVGIFGKADKTKHKYIDYLKLAGISFKHLSSALEVSNLSGVIILEPSDELLLTSLEEGVPILLEIPFARTLKAEVEVLKKLKSYKAGWLLPLISRHHPKLVRLRALIRRGVLGKLSSLHITMSLKEGLVREEESYARIPGKTVYQFLNIVDYLRWMRSTNINDVSAWIIDSSKLIVSAKVEDVVATVVSYSSMKTSDPSGVDLTLEAVGFERILTWDGTEQSLILRGGESELKHVHWGISMDEVIAWHFLELLRGASELDLSDITESYEEAVNLLKLIKFRKIEGGK